MRARFGPWFTRTFQQAPVPTWAAPAWSLVLTTAAVGRAHDNLVRSAAPPPELDAVKGVLGFHAWGLVFSCLVLAVVCGLLCLTAGLGRWPVLIAHALGVGVHVAYTAALAQSTAGSGRGLVALITAAGAAGHLLCVALYLAPRPIRRRRQ